MGGLIAKQQSLPDNQCGNYSLNGSYHIWKVLRCYKWGIQHLNSNSFKDNNFCFIFYSKYFL